MARYLWTDINGNETFYADLEDSHLDNIINMLIKGDGGRDKALSDLIQQKYLRETIRAELKRQTKELNNG